jgi:hypothetical protein
MSEQAGNPVPEGKKFLEIKSDVFRPTGQRSASPRKFTLSGNKSFSFNVGRSGDGRFSQGLNIDFDASLANDLHLRGSVSDRIGSGEKFVSGQGGTTILSDLDKYFFEIKGRQITARGGDIVAVSNRYLPVKRIKGIYAEYNGDQLALAADIGRPAGRFISQRLKGIDGRQGPYQALGSTGLPTGIVPGSEKVYVDGRLLEGGNDKQYRIDYPSGRITFSPRVLITSRSRIEIDFEAAENDYEQIVYDGAGTMRLWSEKLKFSFGGRRESDDRNRLRFGSLSPEHISVLNAAGDSASGAIQSGVTPNPEGAYILVIDTSGIDYYKFVGSDSGDYDVSFSFVGEQKGDYQFLGENVYQFVGPGAGDYLPIIYLPLPIRNDFFFSAVEYSPYLGGIMRLEYHGNIRDNNILSDLDDDDNSKSRVVGVATHRKGAFNLDLDFRFQQQGYDPVYRLDIPDNNRVWALPDSMVTGDETRTNLRSRLDFVNNRFGIGLGYLNFKDNLASHHFWFDTRLLTNRFISPRAG